MNNPNARLEQLLRQWGARRAVGEASAPGVPDAPAIAPAISAVPQAQARPPQAEAAACAEPPGQPLESAEPADQTPPPDLTELEMAPLVLELAESEMHILDPSASEPPPDEPVRPAEPARPQPQPTADADKVADDADSTTIIPTLAGEDLDKAAAASAPAAAIEPISTVEPVSTAPLEHVTADLPAEPVPQAEPISLDMADQPQQAGQPPEEPPVELVEEQGEPDREAAADISGAVADSDAACATDIADPDATVRLELSSGAGEPVTWPTIGQAVAPPGPAPQTSFEKVSEKKPDIAEQDLAGLAAASTIKPAAKQAPRPPAAARKAVASPAAGGKKKSAAALAAKIAGLAILGALLLFAGAVFLSGYAERAGLTENIRRFLPIPDSGARPGPAADADDKAGPEIRKLRADLDAALDQLRKSQDSLRETKDALHKAQDAFITARLEKELQASDTQTRLTAASQQADTARDALQAALKDRQGQLDALKLQMLALEKKLQDANKERAGLSEEVKQIGRLQKDKQEADARYASAADDLRKKTAQINDLEAARKKAQDELAGLQGEFLRITRALQKLYMTASAPGQSGMAAAQAASRHNKLLSRCQALANTPQEPPTRLLRDSIDAALTKLELVPAGDWTAGQKFTKMVDDARVIPLIDETLRGQREAPEINAWLMEVRIILVSAGCAG